MIERQALSRIAIRSYRFSDISALICRRSGSQSATVLPTAQQRLVYTRIIISYWREPTFNQISTKKMVAPPDFLCTPAVFALKYRHHDY